ncbi:hypothetical protein [Variovorax sp. V15]|uniref:hypothetical protein n=1 Tax=Variovorax sp. V15 TaxID=3065952 RepID=UPI0034E8F392
MALVEGEVFLASRILQRRVEMVFLDDSSGFAFSCGDAKTSMGTGSWGARLSQIARVTGSIYIVTGRLLDPDYVSRILGKRPHKISIHRECQRAQGGERDQAQLP